ncbi:MAG: PD-(D/E)XK nuclease family protein, partial [Candidatus Krumholzibacteria bacterium]
LSIVEAKPYSLPDGALRELFTAAGKNASVVELLNEKTLSQVGDEVVRHRCSVLRDLLEDLEDRRGRLDLPTFLVQAMELTQFHYQLFDEGADLRIIESVSKRIFELIEDLVQKREASLAAFLEAIGTLLEKRQFSEEDALYLPEGRVVIMTMHQAKGLEFKAVAIPGIKQPPGRGDGFYLIEGKGLYSSEMERWGRGTKQLDNGRKAEQKKDNAQEERCLHYVAITRAEDHLFLSSSFPGGLQGPKRNKPNLFASVLDSLRGGNIPHEEIREVTPVMAKETAAIGGAGESADLTALLDEWQAGRERLEEARVLARPVPQGLQFVTWRGLYAFAVCPLQYYYRYVAGVQEDLLAAGPREGAVETQESFEISPDVRVPRGMTPVDFGRFVHSFLCEWLGDGKSADAAVEGILDRVADQFDVRGGTRKDAIETASQLAAAYRDEETLRAREIYKSEWPVRRRVGDIVLQGVIDRVDRVGDGFQIIDYKIGVKKDDYEYQLQFYGWALGGVVDKPLSGAVCYLHKPVQLTPVDMSDADLGAIDTHVAELVDATTAGDYHAKPGKVCGSCDYKDICPHAVT